MFFLSLLVVNGENNEIFRIMIISGASALLNLLAIILPNFNICKILRYKRRIYSSEIINSNINKNQLPQINNNVIVNNNFNNYDNINIPVNPYTNPNSVQLNQVQVVNNEYNGNNQNIERNVSINSNDSNNQFVEENSKELGTAPLPAFEMKPQN